ncbi:hypothetical protein J2847_004812 [Azospirillum agricola]|uniref:hypothetical protein n=1 Tax=Azospirillum agricola TaxID=1720247 RepID=UPI001F16522D|nr:hypothetical protein [Azospirillum agricola]MBP2231493.1 hypothetical protein [Azospirillum agricola]
MRIRAEEVLERKGASAPRQAGALAGQFAAMLETLNGVGEASAAGANGPAVAPVAQPALRLGVGAVSLFAQQAEGAEGAGQGADIQPPNPDEGALQVVESAIQAGDGSNFRWLTTLLTQNTAA